MPSSPRQIGRYEIHEELANGGMAIVYLGRLTAGAGVSRTVAIKRLHPQYAKDPEFSRMFVDEARMASRVTHFNVVPTLDVLEEGGELLLVMEYVHGETLARLLRNHALKGRRIPLGVALALTSGVLRGLHAAHESVGKDGRPLGLVHRDVSPQNVLVGVDGQARVFDFGVAKATGRLQHTEDGKIKGKMSYMAPEQLRGKHLDRRADVYAAGIILWELLTSRRLFLSEDGSTDIERVLRAEVEPPTKFEPKVPSLVEGIVMQALQFNPDRRYPTAAAMAKDLDDLPYVATPTEVATWLREAAGEALEERSGIIARMEQRPTDAPLEGTLDDLSSPESGGTSQISALTVARMRERGRKGPLVLALAVLLAVGVGAFVLFGGSQTSPTEQPGAVAEQPPVGSEVPSPEPPVAEQPQPSEPEPSAPENAETEPGDPEVAPHQSHGEDVENLPPAEVKKPPFAPAGQTSAQEPELHNSQRMPYTPKKKNDPCDPPFTFNDKGHKVYKRECF